ncbi:MULTISPECIES: hypothetical protein [Flavobacterium]|uniref:Uncharacterized protein n=1 Tax=Flavobacterium hankyongi TaxID=1176532 RepID=A0ABP8ZQA4_9FLAO|nr:hypothetical protein [Flavobacterium sp. N1846]
MTQNKIIPFGKYKDQPVEILINDPEYRNWLLSQSWFIQKFPELKVIIINNFKEPTNTPEHNKLQAQFLDKEYCLKLSKIVFPYLYANIVKIPERWNFSFGKDLIDVKIERRQFENAGIDVSLSFMFTFKETMDLLNDGTYKYLGKDTYETFPLNIEIKPTVSDDYPTILRQMKASKSNVLFLVEYTGIGIDIETFIKYFANEKIKVIFKSELD